MNFFTSFVAIAAKLMLLACFVTMNGNCFVEARHNSPCHVQKSEHKEFKHKHKGACDQCKISHQNWATPATLQTVAKEKLLPVWETPVLFTDITLEYPRSEFSLIPTRGPPDNLFAQTYARIYRSTRWNTSGR